MFNTNPDYINIPYNNIFYKFYIENILYKSSSSIVYKGIIKNTSSPFPTKSLSLKISTSFIEYDIISTLISSPDYIKYLPSYHLITKDDTYIYLLSDFYHYNLDMFIRSNLWKSKSFDEKIESSYHLLNDLISSLKYIHNHNILYLDLKPHNILISYIDDTIVCKICDFDHCIYSNQSIHSLKGTIGYLDPLSHLNYLSHKNPIYDFSSDTYSLAITLYRCIFSIYVNPLSNTVNIDNINYLYLTDYKNILPNLNYIYNEGIYSNSNNKFDIISAMKIILSSFLLKTLNPFSKKLTINELEIFLHKTSKLINSKYSSFCNNYTS